MAARAPATRLQGEGIERAEWRRTPEHGSQPLLRCQDRNETQAQSQRNEARDDKQDDREDDREDQRDDKN
jgi:hypothetical protein